MNTTQTIICGDSLSYMKTLPDKSFDLVLTDPPYGIGADKVKAHSSIRDNPAWEKTTWDLERPSIEVFNELLRVGKKVAIWGGNYFTDYLPVSSGWIVWSKPQADTGFSLADGELCWTSEAFSLRIKNYGRRDGNMHPTQKPVELMSFCIEKFTEENDTILDPFMGSGTTLVACKHLNRNCVGIEISEKYCAIAQERLDSTPTPMF